MDDLEKIHAQIAKLQQEADVLTSKQKTSVIEDIKSKIRAYGITSKDLGLNSGSKAHSSVPPKYKQGAATWSGRGRQPRWVVEHLEKGGSLDELLV